MIFFKAEANEKIGGGHLHRAMTLAKECRKIGINTNFIFSDTPPKLIEKIINEGFPVYNIDSKDQFNTDAYSFMPIHSLIVFDTDDNRFYSGAFINKLQKKVIKTACYTITDTHEITTDILLNPNIISQRHHYKTAPFTKKYLGPKYMIFRKEFWKIKKTEKSLNTPFHLLLMFGNADIKHLTMYFLDVIKHFTKEIRKVHIVIGELNPDIEKITSKINGIHTIQTELHINTNNIQAIYEDTDVAITSAGMAMWEMALYKIPQIVVASSHREVEYTKYLSELNYIHDLSPYIDIYSSDEMANSILNTSTFNKLKGLKTEEFNSIIDPNGIKNTIVAFRSEIQVKSKF